MRTADRHRTRLLVAVMTSVLVTGLSWGTLVPLLSIILEKQGVSSLLIGLNSAMSVVAVMVVARLLPLLARRLDVIATLIGGLVVIAAALVLMSYWRSLEAWLVLRFIIGLGGALHWILSETWINTLAPPEKRGLYVGIYGTLFMLGFAAGPIFLLLIPTGGHLPFFAVAAGVLLSALPLYFARESLPALDPEAQRHSYGALWLAPAIFVAVLATGLADSALWALLPIYALKNGLSETDALMMVAALNTGTVVLQIGIGWLADRTGTRSMLISSGLLGVAGGIALPFALPAPWLVWPLLFVWGGAIAGLYTLALADLGRRFEGPALAQANGLFVSLYSLGGLAGAPLSGGAIDLFGPAGLPLFVIGVCAIFSVLTLMSRVPKGAMAAPS